MPSTVGDVFVYVLIKAYAPDFAERIDEREARLVSGKLSSSEREGLRSEIKGLYLGGIVKMNVLLYRSSRKRRTSQTRVDP